MEKNKNVKTKIWVYAVVLFTSAFIVLLFAAYSQIKMNKNLENYRNLVTSQKSEKNKYQLSFANAQEINNKLNEEIKKLEDEKKSLSDSIDNLNKQISDLNDKSGKQISSYEELCSIQAMYLNGDIINSSQRLKTLDINQLNLEAQNLYTTLCLKVYNEAGKILYDEGYKLYRSEKYSDAIGKFSLSREMWTKGEYSDNCLYYLAYANYRLGNELLAVEYMNNLIIEYPDSAFLKSARRFVQRHS
jgi:hypothetical protein